MSAKSADIQGLRRKQLLALAKKAGIRRYRRLSKIRLAAALSPLQRGQPEVIPECADLPASYGRTRLVLMEIEPFWVHAYWEVIPEDRARAAQQMGTIEPAGKWVLRFYDLAGSDTSDPARHGFFDLPVDLNAGSWYINLWAGSKSYCAELGAVAPSGAFIPVCRSNVILVPPSAPPAGGEVCWLKVQGHFEKVEVVQEPEGPEPTAPILAEDREDTVAQPARAAASQGMEKHEVMPAVDCPAALPLAAGAQSARRVPETFSSFGLAGSISDRRNR